MGEAIQSDARGIVVKQVVKKVGNANIRCRKPIKTDSWENLKTSLFWFLRIAEGGEGNLMLAPFDSVQVDTLLYKLPEWAQLAEECYSLRHSLQHIVDLTLGRESANAKSDAAVSALVTISKRTENVAGLQRGRSTSTTGRQGNVLKCHEERLSLNIGK